MRTKAIKWVFRAFCSLAVGLSVSLFSAGCAVWTSEAVRYHIIDYPTPKKQIESAIPDTLMVYRFLLDNSVDTRNLVVTTSDGVEESVTLHRWEFDPSDMVTELVQRDLEASGLFEKTVDQWSSARYRYALEGTIERLEGVVKKGKAMAVVQARVNLIDFDSPGRAKKSVMKQEYTIKVPSGDSKPMSIVRAINLAVRQLSQKIQADIAASLKEDANTGTDLDKPETKESTVGTSTDSFPRGVSRLLTMADALYHTGPGSK
jgi:ABC-type uncharacterized transport system auxiliary subunit